MCKKKKIETGSTCKNLVNCSIEWVHCHAIKIKSKTIQWIKSRNCDIIDDK